MKTSKFVVIYYSSNRKLIQWPIIYYLSLIINYLILFYFSFSDWVIIFGNQLFEVFIYKPKFDTYNEWDKYKCTVTISTRVIYNKFYHVVH